MTALLEVVGLSRRFPVGGGALHALDDVGFRLHAGGSIGIIGESGSGKSTLATILARLDDPQEGGIVLDGSRDIAGVSARAFGKDPARRAIQLVFQTAGDALNPAFTVAQNIAIGLGTLRLDAATLERVRKVATEVDLGHDLLDRRPHQLSGGQQARVGIARALISKPRLLILDEPTAALDVSVQATILRLIDRLRRERGLTLAFVSHDLEVVRLMCDSVLVLYLGRVVEIGAVADILAAPSHPYTRALVAASPGDGRGTFRLAGDTASPIGASRTQCLLSTRCPFADERCRSERPALHGKDGRLVACHHADAVAASLDDAPGNAVR
ncbi:MAG: ABC transporter ATP-binding protein [Bauldia sp.]|nr:ABC transporter ATP-binding protein [Bauldia sp.]